MHRTKRRCKRFSHLQKDPSRLPPQDLCAVVFESQKLCYLYPLLVRMWVITAQTRAYRQEPRFFYSSPSDNPSSTGPDHRWKLVHSTGCKHAERAHVVLVAVLWQPKKHHNHHRPDTIDTVFPHLLFHNDLYTKHSVLHKDAIFTQCPIMGMEDKC